MEIFSGDANTKRFQRQLQKLKEEKEGFFTTENTEEERKINFIFSSSVISVFSVVKFLIS
jgi:hypothetical protein